MNIFLVHLDGKNQLKHDVVEDCNQQEKYATPCKKKKGSRHDKGVLCQEWEMLLEVLENGATQGGVEEN